MLSVMQRPTFVLVLLFSVDPTLQFFFEFPDLGEITPKNALGIVNEILELNCTIFDTSVLNSSVLLWECPNSISANPEDVTLHGDHSSLLRKNITNVTMEGTYLCRRSDLEDFLISIVGSVSLVVEYEAVRDVTDFKCVLDQEKQEFHCTWELGKYNHEAYLDVKIEVSPENEKSSVECPQQKIKRSCVWTKDDLNIHSMSKTVNLTITNKEFKVSKTFIKNFWMQNISKPLPTAFINVTSQGLCGCANLTWGTIPGGVDTTTSITLMSQWNTVPLTYVVDVNNSLVVCNLVPATMYTVEVKLKPLDGYYYSNSSETYFETCHMKPSLAPVMESSWYSRSDCVDSKPDFTHTVTVYWQRIPNKYQNGPLKEYKVFLDGALVDQTNHSEVLTSLTVPCHGDHHVSVRGCNQQGCSPESSILIPNYEDVVRPEKVIVEQNKSSPEVYLTWFGVEKENLLAVDIVWCKMKPAGYRCSDDIQVLRSNSTMHKVLHADDIGVAIDEVLFGVAAINARNKSSGIRWQEECRYFKDEAIPVVQSVHLSPDPPRNSLTLNWNPVKCISGVENVYISQYQIVYCQLAETENTCADLEQYKNVSASSVVQVTLRNLAPNVRYGIWVRAVSHAKMGPKSKMVEGQPFNNDLSKKSLVGIVLGGIFGFIFIIAGCTCFLRQIKKTLHLNEKFEIETPVVDSLSNLPKDTPQYHSIPLLSDRSSGLLITANGTTSNGTIPHDSPEGNCKSYLHRRGGRGKDTDESNGPESITKGKGLTLPLVDVPRQISKDSGHGSLSPTTSNPPTTPEKSDTDNYNLKECVSDHTETIPHGSAKATTIAVHGLHGDGYQFTSASAESGSPSPNKEQNQATNINHGEIKMDLTLGNVSYQSNVNQNSHRTAVDQLGSERTMSMNESEGKEDTDNEADQSRLHSQTLEHLSKDPETSDHVSTVLSVPDYVPNTTKNPSPAAFISNERMKQSAMGHVQNETKEESLQHYVPNGSVTDYVPNGTKEETPSQFVPNGSVRDYVLNETYEESPKHNVPNLSDMDYVPNGTKEESTSHYVLNERKDEYTFCVPKQTKEESPQHYVPNGSVTDYVSNGTKEESPQHYVPNGSVGKETELLAEYIQNEYVIDSVLNKTNKKCLLDTIPNGSMSPFQNNPIKVSELGYVRHDKDDITVKNLHSDGNMTKIPTSYLCNDTTTMTGNPDQHSGTRNPDADSEGESDGGNSCSYNSGYISKEMLDSEGNVLDATRPANFWEEEDDSEIVKSGYVPLSAIVAR